MEMKKAVLSAAAVLAFCLVPSASLLAQTTDTFSAEADSLTGKVTKCVLFNSNLTCNSTTIAPVYQSTSTGDFNSSTANAASQIIYGVEAYNLSNLSNTTLGGTLGRAQSSSSVSGSLLGGVITWSSNGSPLNCTPDTTDATGSSLVCKAVQTVFGLVVNGTPVPFGNFPGGDAVEISTTITDPSCPYNGGKDTFNGRVVLEESSNSGFNTNTAAINMTGLHLTGQASCKAPNSAGVELFHIHYDLKVANASVTATATDSSVNINNVAYTVANEFRAAN